MTKRGLLLYLTTFFCLALTAAHSSAQITGDPSWAPVVTLPDDATVTWCQADSICYDITAVDPDATDSIWMSLVSGPIEYTPTRFGHEFTTTICFRPEGSGDYRFVWQFVDRQNHVVTDSVTYTVELGTPPSLEDQQFSGILCDLQAPRQLNLVYTANGREPTFQLLSGPGSIDPSGGRITYEPDTSGVFEFLVALETDCGADTATVTDNLALNLPPYCIGFDTTVYLCDTRQICFDIVARDPEGDPITITMPEGLGTFVQTSDSTGRTCFTPREADSSRYIFIFRAADSCVLAATEKAGEPYCCYDTVIVDVVITLPGELTCHSDTTIHLCVPPEQLPVDICLDGFSSTWKNSTISFGTLEGDSLCFEVDTLGIYTITYAASDTCGHVDTCITRVTIMGNNVPYVTLARDQSIDLCVPETVCIPAAADDLDFDLYRVTTNYGQFSRSSGTICFLADTSGAYTIILTAEDLCGSWDADTAVVTVDLHAPPMVVLGDDAEIALCDLQEVCIDATVTGENIQYFATSTGAHYNEQTSEVCFTPKASGTYEVFLQAIDDCDRVVADTVVIEVSIGSAPAISNFRDTTVYLCYPRQICLDLNISDSDNDIAGVAVNRGQYANNQVCFVPYSMGIYKLIVTATDSCGHVEVDTAEVTVKTDQGISLVTPGDTTIFLCEPDTLCFPIGGIPEGAQVSVSGIATYWDAVTNSICFYSDCCLENKLTVSVTTECGTYSKSFTVDVQTNSRPVVFLPKDTTLLLCEPETVCLPVAISDIDGNVASVAVTGGTYNAYDRTVCFEALEEGVHQIDVTVTDSCGAVATDRMTVTVTLNEAPWVRSTLADSVFRQCELSEVCIPIEFADPDGQQVTITVSGGYLQEPPSGNTANVCFVPSSYGDNCIDIYVIDPCGESDTAHGCVAIAEPSTIAIDCPVTIANTQCGPGQYCVDIPITGEYQTVTTNIGTWSNGTWCVDVSEPIVGNLEIIAVGECNVDSCIVPLNLIPVEPPLLVCPTDVDTLLCGPSIIVFDVPLLSAAGPDESVTANAPATVEIIGRTARLSVPISEPGQQVITLTHFNPPCEPYVCSFIVNARFNTPPVLAVEGTTVESCTLQEICVPFSYFDSENNVVSIRSDAGPVTWANGVGQVCFTPASFGIHELTLTAVDTCDAMYEVPFSVTINQLPSVAIECPSFVTPPTYCGFELHCLDLPIGGQVDSVVTNYGAWANGQLCFDINEPGTYDLLTIAYGPCNVDSCIFPVVYLEPVNVMCSVVDSTVVLCEEIPTTVSIPVAITGDDVQYEIRPNTYPYANGAVDVSFSRAGQYPVTVVAWNDCSRDSCDFVVIAEVNAPPVVTLPADYQVIQCTFAELCVPITVVDPDNDLVVIRTSLGVINGSQVCFTPNAYGEYEIVVTATDDCGGVGVGAITITVVEGTTVALTCPDGPISVDIDLPGDVRIPVGVQPPGFDVTVSPSGTYDHATGEVVVQIESEGLYQFLVKSVADCNTDSCKITLEVGQYIPPFVECVAESDTLLCLSQARQVCLPVTVYGTDVLVEVTPPALFTGDAVCLDVTAPGDYVIDIKAYTDRDTVTCQSVLHVTGGNPPLLTMPQTLDYTLCGVGEVCFDVTMEDAEFDITSIVVNHGSYDINRGQICFLADTAGTYVIEMTVADSCGNATTRSTAATIDFNQPPQVSLGDDRRVFACTLGEVCVDVSIVTDDPVTVTTSLGHYDPEAGQVCFLPEQPGLYELTVEVTDQCGQKASDIVIVEVDANDPPQITPLRDTTIYLCYPRVICLDALVSDPDGNLASVTTSRGKYENGTVCFAPYSMGEYRVVVTATDECGATVTDEAIVTVRTDQGINLVCPEDQTVFLCEPDTLCFPIGGVPDGATVTVQGIAAWWDPATQSVCFYSDCCLENKLTVSVTTPCGTYSCSFTVSVQTNSRPIVLLPRDTTVIQCQLERICLPVGISDIDGNIRNVQVTGASYDAYSRTVCFTPPAPGRYTIDVAVTDSCGAVGTDRMVVDVNLNQPPVIVYTPKDTVYKQCQPEEICLPVGVSDPDNNIADVTVTGGYYDAQTGKVCILPQGVGTFCAQITITDKCGLSATQEVCVEVSDGDRVDIQCQSPEPLTLCEPQTVCVAVPVVGTDYTVTTSYGSWSNNELCFVADTSGSYRIRLIATAQCNADTCFVTVPVTILPTLSVTCPANDSQFLCGADTLCYPFSFTPANATVTVSAPAYLSGGQVCVPVLQPGTQTIRLTVSNQCGTVECSFTVTTTFNGAPVVLAGTDRNYVECNLHEVCFPISISDPNSNITERTTSAGRLVGDAQLCFTPPSYGTHQIIIRVVDACGLSDADTVLVDYTLGASASIQCPDGTQYASVCGVDTICILAPITPANATVTIRPSGIYKPQTGEVCIPVSQGGTIPVEIIAAAQCGADTCRFNLEVDMGVKPVVQCPGRIDTLLCLVTPDTLRVPITASGTGLQVNVNPTGYYAAGYVNLPITQAGQHNFEVIAFGRCGADTCEIEVNVTADQAPLLTVPTQMTFERCPDDIDDICIGGIFATDAESDVTITKVCGPGSFVSQSGDSGAVCFVPASFGQVQFCFEATDGCHVVQKTFLVNVTVKPDCDVCVRLSIDGGADSPVGLRKKVAVNVETNDPIGGFDILIGYDKSALIFQLGSMAGGDAEAWEYFTWASDVGSCSGCPTGVVRFVGIADRNNGAAHPPDSAYRPNGKLFDIEYLIVNDQNLGNQFVPISFVWNDCSDNALSDTTGTILYIDSRVYNPEGQVIWDEFDDANYPESARQSGLGAPDTCIVEGAKSQAVRCVEFHNGGIKIISPEDIDDRGDINLNMIAYEIADAVVFTNYFIRGLAAFTINVAGQIAATDVNADGLTLTVADLSLLIRVIIGDANPIPKVTPYAERAEVITTLDGGAMRIGVETAHGIGAAYLVYDIAPGTEVGEPYLLPAAADFDLRSGILDGQLRLLLYDIGTAEVDAGLQELIEIPVLGEGVLTLAHAEIVDYQSRPYLAAAASLLPDEYELRQNYPNPFNPSTTISFALPVSTGWSLKVYNIAGAMVWEQGGNSAGGVVDVVWDGRSSDGDLVASGVYLYRLDANTYSNTRKMILLK
ncbi:MAG: T9SS type A sorting domain-containing protein [Candidatus Zixiibacteriota bacterium]